VVDFQSVAGEQVALFVQSTLAKEFSDDLGKTEADLAHREGRDYEPASVLLERIATERAATENGKPT
jgi:type I restriction enzyme S subunit